MNTMTMKLRLLQACVGVAIAMSGSQALLAAENGPVVRIDSGKVRGVVRATVAAFKGIPFAQPPVGALRWRPPQAPSAWRGVRAASSYGPDCMQVPFPGDAARSA